MGIAEKRSIKAAPPPVVKGEIGIFLGKFAYKSSLVILARNIPAETHQNRPVIPM